MWKKIKNLFMYAMLTPDQFDKVGKLVASENAFAIKLASVVQILYFGVSFVSSLGMAEMADKKLVYGIGTIVPVVILMIYLTCGRRHSAVLPWLVKCYGMGLFLTGLLCTLICTPGEMTILLLIFFFCIPMIFVSRPLDMIVLVLITDAIYFIVAPFVKAPEVLTMDMIDVATFSTLSMILGVSHMQGRYRRYWLETEAVDLAQIRYQAAFIDQLTGLFNRNAYNRDTERIEMSKLPSDFMFMALDLNGMKTANDSFGHVAGDELLIGAAKCMRKVFENFGTIYRIGGDEFIIMLNTKGASEADLLKTFHQAINEWSGTLVQELSISYGFVMGNEVEKMTFHEIELLADKRMYQSKSDYYKNAGVDRRKL